MLGSDGGSLRLMMLYTAAPMRIAAVQCPAIDDDVLRTCAIVVERLQWAAERSIDLLLFPEAFLLGHSYDPDIIRRRAQEATRGAVAALCRCAAPYPATLVIGAFEVAGSSIFNAALVIEGGEIVGRYAKAHPNEPGVTPGRDVPTFLRTGIRYGINICNDANHAAAAEPIARQGGELILYPLNNMLPPDTAARWREKSLRNLIERARQTGCWVVSGDVTGTRGADRSYGCTTIVAPDGKVMARVPEEAEGTIVYDIPARPGI